MLTISESLRLHPPLPNLTKHSTTDYTLPKMSLKINNGTLLVISAYGLHMDEKYYPNPLKFDPERFSADAVAKRDKYAFLPFGDGPRKCIGKIFQIFKASVCTWSVHSIVDPARRAAKA